MSVGGDDSTKNILRTLITLAIPTILEEVMSTLIQYVDTAMVGQLGEKATAAVSTTTTINWLIHAIPAAISVAVLAISAKAMGAGDRERLKRISGQGIFLAFFSGIILEILAMTTSPYIPVWMGASSEIRDDASMYFSIISTTLFLRTASRVFASSIRATKDTRTPMLISLSENILNVILNYIFIYALSMGVRGAAIASAISYGLGGLAMYTAFRKNEYLRCSYRMVIPDKNMLAEVTKIGLPALFTTITSCLGYVVFAGMVSGMGTRVFAAHSIAVAAEEIVYIPGYGLRMATSTLVGNSYGEGNMRKLKITEELSISITILIMVINGSLLYLFARPLMNIFTSSPNVAELGSQMLRMVAFSEPFFGLMIVIEGIFYGVGKTRDIFLIEAVSMWGVRIASTFVCVKIMHLSLHAVWMCMIADNVCKAVLLFLVYIIWIKKRNLINS